MYPRYLLEDAHLSLAGHYVAFVKVLIQRKYIWEVWKIFNFDGGGVCISF